MGKLTSVLTGTAALTALLALVTPTAAYADPADSLSATLTNTTAYPYADGYLDTFGVLVTRTGTANPAPLSGTVTVTEAGKSVVTPFTLPAATTSIAVNAATKGLTQSSAQVVTTLTDTDGAALSAPAVSATLAATAVTKLKVPRSLSTVYPVKDGYRDSVSFNVNGTTSTGKTLKVSGSATLKYGKHTVKSWKLTSSNAKLSWNGKYGSKVKSGKYSLTVSEKGPEGATQKASTSVTVSAKHLVSRTATKTYTARAVIGGTYHRYNASGETHCYLDTFSYGDYLSYHRTSGAIFCEASDSSYQGYDWPYGIVQYGKLSIPSAVRHSSAYAKPTVYVTAKSSINNGKAVLGLAAGSATSTHTLRSGSSAGHLSWSGNPSKLEVDWGLTAYTYAGVKSYTISYHYKTLV
jgi:hypothetical protein